MPEPAMNAAIEKLRADWDARMASARRDAERDLGIQHIDGTTWWHDAPLPRRWHRCTPWTTSFQAYRCACGAIRSPGDRFWLDRNSRRSGKW